MPRPARLDQELVRRGLVASRAEAGRAIDAGHVTVRGFPATRASTMVRPEDPIAIARQAARFVSRGGEKLRGALDVFEVDPAGKRWLDAGASTGGFTDCLLQAGATAVIAADVGYGQLHWSLRSDGRVVVMERKNLRELVSGDLPWVPDGVVADLSFISLVTVLPALLRVMGPAGDLILLVKPQFEAGREAVGRTGVVNDPEVRAQALRKVAQAAQSSGAAVGDACASPLKGPSGNVEYFLHCRKGDDRELNATAIDAALEEGERL